jgi:hypothetical protein
MRNYVRAEKSAISNSSKNAYARPVVCSKLVLAEAELGHGREV